MRFLVWKNAKPLEQNTFADRGFFFGDGVFESIALTGGKPCLPELHFERLEQSLKRLHISADIEQIRKDFQAYLAANSFENERAYVLKIVVTAGDGQFGYQREHGCNVYFFASELASAPNEKPIAVRESSVRLAQQVLLAGIKHLNRLEQSLAINELKGLKQRFDDCLMLDAQEQVIELGASNILFEKAGKLYTPKLDACGVEGVFIKHLSMQGFDISACRIAKEQLHTFTAAYACNSVKGLRRIATLELLSGEKIVFNKTDLALPLQQASLAVFNHV